MIIIATGINIFKMNPILIFLSFKWTYKKAHKTKNILAIADLDVDTKEIKKTKTDGYIENLSPFL